jgi:streptomycin 6-kinase
MHNSQVLSVPTVVRNKAVAAGAHAWLEQLPLLLQGLVEEWDIRIGATYTDATEAFVAEADCADGTDAVIKLALPLPGDPARHEINVLRAADGDGCARLLRSDGNRGAMLLERLGRSLFQTGLPIQKRYDVLCATAAKVWRPAAGLGLPTGAEKGRWLSEFITRSWIELDRPCSERAVEQALACADRRIAAHDDERAVLVHGDVHQWNTLEAAGGFKLVDPDGLLAEREYDIGVLMREDPEDLLGTDGWERAHGLAHRTGLDATAIWEWGVVERVSTGLLCSRIDLQPVGRLMLTVADQLAH